MGKPTKKYSEVYDEVVAWVNENGYNPNNIEITMESTFFDDLRIKLSLFIIELLDHLKKRFAIAYPSDITLSGIKTVGDLVVIIAKMITH